MSVRRRMQGAGIAPLAAATIAGIFKGAIVASGVDRFSAELLYNDINYIVSVGAGTGVALPSDMEAGDSLIAINTTLTACNVWMPIGGGIDGGSPNVPSVLAAGQTLEYLCIDGQNFRSMGGAVLSPTGITPGPYGSPSTTLEITFGADGRATAAAAVAIGIAGPQVTSGTVAAVRLAPINLSLIGSNGGVATGSVLPTAEGGTGVSIAAQNAFLAGPSSGGSGALTVRAIASADLPAINLASSTSGGVSGLLPSANLAPTGVTASTVGSSTAVPVLGINAQGQIVSITTAAISGGSTSDPAISKTFSGGVTIDLSAASYYFGTVTGNTSFTFSSAPGTGTVGACQIEMTSGSVATITWPASVKWPGGAAPTLSSGKDLLSFITRDGGTTYEGIGQGFLFS